MSWVKEKLITVYRNTGELRRHYRRAKSNTRILDNDIIHKSKQTEE